MTLSSREELKNWLLNENAVSMEFRLKRLKHIVEAYDLIGDFNSLAFPGEIALRLFEEIRWCFVTGQDMSCVMAVQAFLEAGLSNQLTLPALASDGWLKQAGFGKLVDKCLKEGLVSLEDAAAYNKLRKLRIQYVHPEPAFSEKHIAHRMLGEEKHLSELAELDAHFAIAVLFDYMIKYFWRI